MSNHDTRLRRLEAVIPAPSPPPDLSRLTFTQRRRWGELWGKVEAVGFDGLTDEEVDEGAEIALILKAPEPPSAPRRSA